MTVPHLMNCPHRDDGWCGQCVAELGNENWRLRAALSEAAERTKKLQALLRECSGPMSRGHWSSDFRLKVQRAVKPNAGLQGRTREAGESLCKPLLGTNGE